MKLQNLTIIFIIIILPIVIVLSAYVGYGIQTINKENMYNSGLVKATHDAVFAFELNTKNDQYSDNAEKKRSNIKASIKTFENSLSTACNLGLYNNEEIEKYIPAIVFGLYDGFYMYSPSENSNGEFKHNLRNYIYYSEEINEGDINVVIRYTLDNYIAVSGTIGDYYVTKAGYLIDLEKCSGFTYEKPSQADDKIGEATINEGGHITYEGAEIKSEENLHYYELIKGKPEVCDEPVFVAEEYFKESIAFSRWFEKFVSSELSSADYRYLKINNDNDPENENSPFVQHKRQIMKDKIESALTSSIVTYARKSNIVYKMPKFIESDWEKIYSNISVIGFVEGINIGFKNYNNYCILNSTNNTEYVNSNLMYFSDRNEYHDIRCNKIKDQDTIGYRIGAFEKIKYEIQDENTKEVTDTNYYYKHNELACYDCINGNVGNNTSIYEYVRSSDASSEVQSAYFTSLARERYRTVKLLSSYNNAEVKKYIVRYEWTENDGTNSEEIEVAKGDYIALKYDGLSNLKIPIGKKFSGWTIKNTEYNYRAGEDIEERYQVIKKTIFVPWFEKEIYTVTFDANGGSVSPATINVSYDENYGSLPIPEKTGYSFDGWYTASNGGTEVTVDTKVEKTYNHTLYAHWTAETYRVTFDVNGGSSISTSGKNVTYGAEYGMLPRPNRLNYNFDGWYTEQNGGTLVESTTKVTQANDHTLYAHWQESNCEIRYHDTDKNVVRTDTVVAGTEYTLQASNILTSPGSNYYFVGWSLIQPSTVWNNLIKQKTITVHDNIDLYPGYLEIEEPKLQWYYSEALLAKYKLQELTPNEVNGTFYTNKEKISYGIGLYNVNLVQEEKGEGFAESGYFETESGSTRTLDLTLKVTIKNCYGEVIKRLTFNKDKRLIVDREKPVLKDDKITRIEKCAESEGLFGIIKHNPSYSIKLQATDNKGIEKVEVKYSVLTHNLTRTSGTDKNGTYTDSCTEKDCTNKIIITITDYAGNSYSYTDNRKTIDDSNCTKRK